MARRTWDPASLVAITGEPARTVAAMLGVDPAVLCRPLSDAQADRFAAHLGYHPAEVWGPSWWAGE